MPVVAAVVLPVAIVTWVVTGLALRMLPSSSPQHGWLDANRWWFAWLLLAVYLGVVLQWLAAPVTLAVGAGVLHVDRRWSRQRHA